MSGSDSAHTLLLIDGHALTFRSLYALRKGEPEKPRLTSPSGEATDAITGFMNTLIRLAKYPDHQVVVVFDPPTKTFRHEQWPEYKAGRNAAPSDFGGQLARIKELIDALGFVQIEKEGYEADDVIASLTRLAMKKGMPVRISTSDRDVYQLLGNDVRVINKDFELYGPDEVQRDYGVNVSQWVDFRALTGDNSDNIPGAKGIGPKTAAKLLDEYSNLENIYAAAKEGTLKTASTCKKLLESEENVWLSRQLSTMVDDLDISIPWEKERSKGDPHTVQALITELGLAGLKKALLTLEQPEQPDSFPERWSIPLSDWQEDKQVSAERWWGYSLSTTYDLKASLLEAAVLEVNSDQEKYLSKAPSESTMPGIFGDFVIEQSHSKRRSPQHNKFVSTHHWSDHTKINAADAKALATHLMIRGKPVEPYDDPLLCAYLLDPALTDMERVCQRYLGCSWPEDATERASLSAQLWDLLYAQMTDEQKKLYCEIERPLSVVLAAMEVRGITIDSAYLKAMSGATEGTLIRLEEQIQDQAGEVFSVRSPKQLETILFDKLKLSSQKKTKTKQRSTAVGSLEPLREDHPIIPLILEYRELDKLRGTYLEPLPALVHPKTGRLHTTFHQTAVATGRLSSLNPNLQNIPIRSQMGRELRKGFVAAAGMKLISADYSQIELRLLAHMSGDALMQQAFQDGADIHRRTAARVMGITEEQVTAEQRRAAKTVNFGVLYGMSAHRLSQSLGISYDNARTFIENYFATYPKIADYIENTLRFGREHGYVQTLYGRRRYVPELNTSSHNKREAAERLAYNMPIQGTASDIIKMAMVSLYQELSTTGSHLLLQVHDELLLEAPTEEADHIARITQSIMENIVSLDVPLSVEVGIGDNWLDTK